MMTAEELETLFREISISHDLLMVLRNYNEAELEQDSGLVKELTKRLITLTKTLNTWLEQYM